MNLSSTQILRNKKLMPQEEKMYKACEQVIHINTVGQCSCGECSSSPVFKNAKSNLKGQRNAKYLKGIICNFGKGLLE